MTQDCFNASVSILYISLATLISKTLGGKRQFVFEVRVLLPLLGAIIANFRLLRNIKYIFLYFYIFINSRESKTLLFANNTERRDEQNRLY